MNRGYRKWVSLGAMFCCLNAPLAIAGPQQDTETAEAAYRKGDLILAMRQFRRAAQEGYAPAQVRLGDLLDFQGEPGQAVEWYRKAVAQGSVAGEFNLGNMLLRGEGVAKDDEKARFYILRSADQNYVPAMRLLVKLYKSGGAGLPVDLEQSGKWEDKIYGVTGETRPVAKPAPSVQKKN